MHQDLTYFQALVMGVLQGISELFPISSLGHSVVFPALVGWKNIVRAQSANSSYFLSFLVGLHVATAAALFIYFRHEWKKIIWAFFRTLKTRKIEDKYERLAWLLGIATIPAGITGLAFEHIFRTLFAKPLAASLFLIVNAGILAVGEVSLRRGIKRKATFHSQGRNWDEGHRPLATLNFKEAAVIGTAQVLALLAGISRSGVTMVAGLVRGMDHEDAARFSFLLATPIIFAAGIYKVPGLLGPAAAGIRPQILLGSIGAFIAAYISVAFLIKYFKTNNLYPFAIYSFVAGVILTIRFS